MFEMFGGYNRYFWIKRLQSLKQCLPSVLTKMLNGCLLNIPDNWTDGKGDAQLLWSIALCVASMRAWWNVRILMLNYPEADTASFEYFCIRVSLQLVYYLVFGFGDLI